MGREYQAKRRGLGFKPINEPFEGCHGHHLDEVNVMFIPKWLHEKYPHRLKLEWTMKRINEAAWKWYRKSKKGIQGNADEW